MAIYSENAIRAGLVSNGQATPTLAAFSVKWMLVITKGSQEGVGERERRKTRVDEDGWVVSRTASRDEGGWEYNGSLKSVYNDRPLAPSTLLQRAAHTTHPVIMSTNCNSHPLYRTLSDERDEMHRFAKRTGISRTKETLNDKERRGEEIGSIVRSMGNFWSMYEDFSIDEI